MVDSKDKLEDFPLKPASPMLSKEQILKENESEQKRQTWTEEEKQRFFAKILESGEYANLKALFQQMEAVFYTIIYNTEKRKFNPKVMNEFEIIITEL